MSQVFGDLKFINSRSKNFKLELLSDDPNFISDEIGRLYFNFNGSLRVNDGNEWITVQFSNNSQNPLVDSLGRNWLNDDLSFNPTPFNDEFNNVNDLTSNDTLYDVLKQLDRAISTNGNTTFSTLSDVRIDNPQAADVIIIGNDGNITNINLNTLANERLNLSSDKLSDFKVSQRQPGDIFKFSNNENKFVNTKIYFEYTNTSSNIRFFSVQHNLNQQYCFVQVINPQTNFLIRDYQVTFPDVNRLEVTLTNASPVKILVFGFNPN